MPKSIDQPARPDDWKMRSVEELTATHTPPRRWSYDERSSRRHQVEVATVMAVTRLTIPFEDVLFFVFKCFVAEAIITLPIALVLWVAFLR